MKNAGADLEGQGSPGATAAASAIATAQATLGAVPSQQHLATSGPQSGIIERLDKGRFRLGLQFDQADYPHLVQRDSNLIFIPLTTFTSTE